MIVSSDARIESTLTARRPGAAVLSAGLHVLVLTAWLLVPSPKPHDLGAGVLTVQVLLEPPPPQPEPESEPEPKPEPPQPPPPEPAKPEPPPPPKPAPVKPLPKPTPRPAPVAAPLAEPAPTDTPATTDAPAAQPVMTDSAATATPAPAANAVALGNPAARQAERNDYLRIVWARIMRFRPDRVRLTGTTRLSFALGLDGNLLSVEIAESSGSDLLDRTALDAVRRAAPFPPPPLGSTLADLAFSIPFQFRPVR